MNPYFLLSLKTKNKQTNKKPFPYFEKKKKSKKQNFESELENKKQYFLNFVWNWY